MRRTLSLVALALVVTGWVTLLFSAPAAASPRWSAVAYAAGSLICHQQPERSFHVHAAQVPVCARCAGLYGAALLGVLAWIGIAGAGAAPRARAGEWLASPRLPRMLIAAALPTALSVATAMLGWWDGDNVTRALLAIPLGSAIGLIVAAVAAGDLR